MAQGITRSIKIMAVNGKYLHPQITVVDIVEEAKSWGIKNASEEVIQTLETIKDFVEVEVPHPRAYGNLSNEIVFFTENLLNGKPAGSA